MTRRIPLLLMALLTSIFCAAAQADPEFDSLQNRIDENRRKLDNEPLNDATRQQLEEDLNEARQDIDEEKHHHFESFVMLLFSLFVAVIYVWITPFTAIGNYCRNYLFHRTPSAGPNARA